MRTDREKPENGAPGELLGRKKHQRKTPPLSELLRRVMVARLTGHLDLREGSIRRRLSFVEGQPVHARSNLVREHLLRFLLQTQAIDKGTYTRYLGRVQEGKWRGGKSLLKAGVLSEALLREAETQLAQQIFLTCFGWKKAEGTFVAMSRASSRSVEIDLFGLYEHWLLEQVSTWRVHRQIERFRSRTLRWTRVGREHRDKVGSLLERHILLEDAVGNGWSVEELLVASGDRADTVSCAVLSLFYLGGIELRGQTEVHKDHDILSTSSSPMSTAPSSSPENLRSSREAAEVVRAELLRVRTARSPYEVLGLSRGASLEDMDEAHARFERFYRAPQFLMSGDESLTGITVELLACLDQALHDLYDEAKNESVDQVTPIEESQTIAVRSIKLDPVNVALARIFFEDGRSYLKLGDFHEAMAHFAQSLERHPEVPRYQAFLGWSLYLCSTDEDFEDRMRGQSLVKEALTKDPGLDEAYVLLGHIYCRSGKINRGAEMYQRALDVNPTNEDANSALESIRSQ